jgi:hypothetical protein
MEINQQQVQCPVLLNPDYSSACWRRNLKIKFEVWSLKFWVDGLGNVDG